MELDGDEVYDNAGFTIKNVQDLSLKELKELMKGDKSNDRCNRTPRYGKESSYKNI